MEDDIWKDKTEKEFPIATNPIYKIVKPDDVSWQDYYKIKRRSQVNDYSGDKLSDIVLEENRKESRRVFEEFCTLMDQFSCIEGIALGDDLSNGYIIVDVQIITNESKCGDLILNINNMYPESRYPYIKITEVADILEAYY